MNALAKSPKYHHTSTCQFNCRKAAVIALKGVPLCMTHYCDALRGIAGQNVTVRDFRGDVLVLAAQVDRRFETAAA